MVHSEGVRGMDAAEKEWIDSRYPDYGSAVGKCAEASHAMAQAFPRLRVTNGEVWLAGCGEPRLHWWCVAPDGEVIDPTAKQFSHTPAYIEIDQDHPARNYERARCPNCGEAFYMTEEAWRYSPLCSQSCATDYATYCNGAL